MYFENGSNLSGSADFGHTLSFIGIDLRDENGNLVTDGTVTGTSGSTYQILDASKIPEPSSALLGLLGAVTLLRRKK